MGFYVMVNGIFAVLGLVLGSLLAILFRKKRFYLYGLLGIFVSLIPTWYVIWYMFGYRNLGEWSLWLAYFACGMMVAEFIALLPILAFTIFSTIRVLRPFLQTLTGITLLGALSIGIYGSVFGNINEEVEHIDITSPKIPASFEGYKIAQISDTHIGPYIRVNDLPKEFERAHDEGAKVVFFTGDLIDDVKFMPQAAKAFTDKYKEFPDGILYIWGNHEYYRGKAYIDEELRKTPVKMLVNEHTVLERGDSKLYVAGVDYPWKRGEEGAKEREDMADKAFAGIPKGAPTILLAHHSDFLDQGFERGAILTLAGHTHGGQSGFFGKPIFTPFKYTVGMYSDGVNKGYVNRGSGSWFPFRIFCPREITIITLHHGK